MAIRLLLLLSVLSTLALQSCSATSARAMLVADEAMNGKRITLHRGDELTIELPENPSTGYRWKADDDSDGNILEAVGSRFASDDTGSGALGVGGTRRFTFRATGIGSCSLHYTLIPPGRDRSDGQQHYSIDVVVTD